ncbi:hypothetical protein DBR06_SOUSAS1410083, partial [Sousa chinensis]
WFYEFQNGSCHSKLNGTVETRKMKLIKEWHFTCASWEAASAEWVVEPSGTSDTLEEAGALLKGTAKGIIISPSSDTPKNLRG